MNSRQSHWESVYAAKAPDSVSWYQRSARVSLDMIRASNIARDVPIIDIGGGASVLADELLDAGFADVSVLDIAGQGLTASKSRLGDHAREVHWIVSDVLTWTPPRTYGLWHDRAVFHFLTEPEDRAKYRSVLQRAVRPGGAVIMATFAPEGPERCSGLPVQRWSAEGLAAELGAEFELVQSAREEHETPMGAVQAFTWCRFKRR